MFFLSYAIKQMEMWNYGAWYQGFSSYVRWLCLDEYQTAMLFENYFPQVLQAGSLGYRAELRLKNIKWPLVFTPMKRNHWKSISVDKPNQKRWQLYVQISKSCFSSQCIGQRPAFCYGSLTLLDTVPWTHCMSNTEWVEYGPVSVYEMVSVLS